jgi:hypothetical protein
VHRTERDQSPAGLSQVVGIMSDMEATSLRFAAAARSLGEVARAGGLTVPGFRSPPRLDGVDRTLKRQVDSGGVESFTVSVRIKGRPWVSVLADMIDGVIAANRIEGPTAGAARTVMWAAVEADAMRGTHPECAAGSSAPGARVRTSRNAPRRAPQPAHQGQTKVA